MQRIRAPNIREPSWRVRALQKLLARGKVALPRCEKYQYAAVEAMINWQIAIATSQFLHKYFHTKTVQKERGRDFS